MSKEEYKVPDKDYYEITTNINGKETKKIKMMSRHEMEDFWNRDPEGFISWRCGKDLLDKVLERHTTHLLTKLEEDLKALKIKGVKYDAGSNSQGYKEGRNQTIQDVLNIINKYKKEGE